MLRIVAFVFVLSLGCCYHAAPSARGPWQGDPAMPVAYRTGCYRICPAGERLTPVEPQADHIEEDCCVDLTAVDPSTHTYSSCAWNFHVATGRPGFITNGEIR